MRRASNYIPVGLLCGALALALTHGCSSETASLPDPDFGGLDSSVEDARTTDFGHADQSLFDHRRFSIDCQGTGSTECTSRRASLDIETSAEQFLAVKLLNSGTPVAGEMVNFSFIDGRGLDVSDHVLQGVRLQARSVITDRRGVALLRITTGSMETDVSIRASVVGLLPVEWELRVRRLKLGHLEVAAVYRPGRQQTSDQRYEASKIFLLPRQAQGVSCESYRSNPDALVVHALREVSASFGLGSSELRSIATFDNVNSGQVYTVIGLVNDDAGSLIAYGCLEEVDVLTNKTVRYDLNILEVERPLNYKGKYKLRIRMDLSALLGAQSTQLDEELQLRLAQSFSFNEFILDMNHLSDDVGDRSLTLMGIFCDYVNEESEACRRIEHYAARGLLTPILDEIMVAEAPLFFHVLGEFNQAFRALGKLEVEAFLNVPSEFPDGLGVVLNNDLYWSNVGFNTNPDCRFEREGEGECSWQRFDLFQIHLSDSGQFYPLRALVDLRVDEHLVHFDYHELEIHFGFFIAKLLERWFYPQLLNTDEEVQILDVLRLALPCSAIDEFLADISFCDPFFIPNLERVIRDVLGHYHFGGSGLGFSGRAHPLDDDRDFLVDGFGQGRLSVYLPPFSTNGQNIGSVSTETLGQQRQTDLVSACFSACRCESDTCFCEPIPCELH